jgi:hypothetical protein
VQQSDQSLGFNDLAPNERKAVYWAFIWRGWVASTCALLGGGIAGAAAGVLVSIAFAAMGVSRADYPRAHGIAGGIAGAVVGTLVYVPYVWSVFRANFGVYRLRLVAARVEPSNPPTERPLT